MAALPNLITVEQFRQLPESGEFAYELHYGEVVAVTRPRAGHWDLQLRLMDMLRRQLPRFTIGIEWPGILRKWTWRRSSRA